MITVTPWLAPAPWNPTNYPNTQSVLCTHIFGFTPIISNPYSIHRGVGDPVRCEYSGEWFPESRIRTQWNGKVVGDIYYEEGPRRWR